MLGLALDIWFVLVDNGRSRKNSSFVLLTECYGLYFLMAGKQSAFFSLEINHGGFLWALETTSLMLMGMSFGMIKLTVSLGLH
jgi:hypothetical protein